MAAAQVPVQEKRSRRYAKLASANHRVGVLWSPEEEENLKREFFDGTPLEEIAQSRQRTVRAIELRLAKIAAQEVDETNPVTDICAKYRVTETMVKRELAKMERAKIRAAQPPKERVKKADLLARIVALEEQVQELRHLIQ